MTEIEVTFFESNTITNFISDNGFHYSVREERSVEFFFSSFFCQMFANSIRNWPDC